MEFLWALSQIMIINIILSGDNAVVIALASHRLQPKQRKLAIFWGSAGAIGLRIALTAVAVALLAIPYLQFFGGILLVWIAVKLLTDEKSETENINAADSFWTALKTILVADVVMSLDNTLAIAGQAKGDFVLLALGLALSIPLIIYGSSIIAYLMDSYPIIIDIGAALIAWTAGKMIVDDPKVGIYILQVVPEWLPKLVITVGVIGFGRYLQWKRRQQSVAAQLSQQ